MTYKTYLLICPSCGWGAPFLYSDQLEPEHPSGERFTICNDCHSELLWKVIDSSLHNEFRRHPDTLRGRCGNRWSGDTNLLFLQTRVLEDRNDFGWWLKRG